MALDTYGRQVDEVYAIISDPTFERRLKDFDPRLKLMFDQESKRWMILEWAYDNSGWNIILKAEDRDGKPKALGDWVFNKLFVYRQNWLTKAEKGADRWLEDMAEECRNIKAEKERKVSEVGQEKILDDINEWRRGARELDGRPTSDVTAGYPKQRSN
jgi:hypothetical protein